jgi:hypothetical protein
MMTTVSHLSKIGLSLASSQRILHRGLEKVTSEALGSAIRDSFSGPDSAYSLAACLFKTVEKEGRSKLSDKRADELRQ